MSAATELPAALAEASGDQPGVQAALAAELAAGPSHAYSFVGPNGAGKRATARAFAAELLSAGSEQPDEVRRRVLADPSPHPDLAWLRPAGNQHLVEEVRERVIGAVSYRPFESERRVFVLEDADAMAEESQNGLLKTLEEPPSYVHILLISSEPDGLLETVRSRCRQINFQALPRELIERRLAAEVDKPPETIAALAALADGDLGRARMLASARGNELRAAVEACASAAIDSRLAERPWTALLAAATEAGEEEAARVEAAAAERAEEIGKGRDADRVKREGGEAAKRANRRARTAALDSALALTAAWYLDLISHAEGAGHLARNSDRSAQLAAAAEGLDPAAARGVAERAMATRRRLGVNVNEELALEALFHHAASTLGES